MKKLSFYLETSIFGFYYDEKPQNIEKRESTRRLLEQVRDGFVYGLVSDLTIGELEKTPPAYGKQLLELLEKYKVGKMTVDEEKASELAELYLSEDIIPADYRNDAFHVAIATVEEVDVLVTWNCEHLANEFQIRKIRALNLREGYFKELAIRTPQEVIVYGN